MAEVIMDGRFKGWTQDNYEKMRKLDCDIACYLGWRALDQSGILWSEDVSPTGGHFRDEEDGVPFFSADMNGAMQLLEVVAKWWRYAGREVFYARLQRLATFNTATIEEIAYPDCLTSLIFLGLSEAICKAFLSTCQWAEEHNFDLYGKPERPASVSVFAQQITDTDEDGNEHKRMVAGLNIQGKPPWVHDVVN